MVVPCLPPRKTYTGMPHELWGGRLQVVVQRANTCRTRPRGGGGGWAVVLSPHAVKRGCGGPRAPIMMHVRWPLTFFVGPPRRRGTFSFFCFFGHVPPGWIPASLSERGLCAKWPPPRPPPQPQHSYLRSVDAGTAPPPPHALCGIQCASLVRAAMTAPPAVLAAPAARCYPPPDSRHKTSDQLLRAMLRDTCDMVPDTCVQAAAPCTLPAQGSAPHPGPGG